MHLRCPPRSISGIGVLFGLIAWSTAAAVAADSDQTDHRRHHVKTYVVRAATVSPQPFSLQPRSVPSMQVAYYSPRPKENTAPIVRGEEETEDTAPRFDVGGSHPMVHGNRAVLRNGVAYAPSNAPDRVKAAIWAVNTIRRKPYVWGGGHGSFSDRGYDCSGTVSFALHYARALNQPLASSDLRRYGEPGRGRWITIYSRPGHSFALIAGLRLDTTDFRYGGDIGPRWHLDGRSTWGFEARHPVGL